MGMGPHRVGRVTLAPSTRRVDPPLMSDEARGAMGEEEKKKSAVGQ